MLDISGQRAPELMRALEAVIDDAARSPHRRVPPERELATQLAATRAEVRRLLTHFEETGRITRHVGRGTFALPASDRRRDDADFTPAAVMTASLLLEPEVAGLAAINATREHLDALQHCLDRALEVDDDSWVHFEHWDISLHRAVAAATQNRELLAMVDLLNSARDTPIWAELKRRGATAHARARAQDEHRCIVEAIAARDRRAAAEAMTEHLRSVRRSVLRIEP